MGENNKKSRNLAKKILFKAAKATIKGVLFYALYFVIWMIIAPVSVLIPSLQHVIEIFVIVYISLMIIEEFASGTIFQYFFNVAKSLFVIGYLIFSLKGGIFSIDFQGVNLMVDLRLFLAIAIALSLLGLAKSMCQAINYLNQREELRVTAYNS